MVFLSFIRLKCLSSCLDIFPQLSSERVIVIWPKLPSRFGYSISVSLLPVEEDALGEFIQKAVQKRNMGAFGMLDAPWSVNTSKLYVEFVTALNATARKMLPVDNQPVLVFGLNTDRATTIEYNKFWESHAAIFDQVHVLIYQDHFELGGDAGKCQARLPASRFPQSDAVDQTVQVTN